LVSAHRCGGAADPAYDNSPAGVRYAASIGADYVEFDVRRAADGALVCRHDPVVAGRPVTDATGAELVAAGVADLDDLLSVVAECGLGAHVDLKGDDPGDWALDLADRCAATLDVGRVVFTTGSPTAAKVLAQWSDDHPAADGDSALVGLTIGGSTKHLRLPAAIRARIGELYPTQRWRASGAGVLVAHHVLARMRLLRWAHRREVRVLVWTVDSPRVVSAALRDKRVWMVTTNRAEAAIALRDRLSR
jgi:glycerophosphoryl diester phosphodiesterase